MKRTTIIHKATIILLFLSSMLPSHAQLNQKYTERKPVVIVSDWDMPPYEFRNNNGEPDGYNIELVTTILRKLRIPYKVVMTELELAFQSFEAQKADLMIDPSNLFHGQPYFRSNAIGFQHVKVATLKENQQDLKLSQLTDKDTILLYANGFTANRIINELHIKTPYLYKGAKEALGEIMRGRYQYFIWGEAQLKWKIRELALDNIVLSNIDVADGELHVVGFDRDLINAIDDEFARMEQSGELERISDKWFHPELVHNDTSPFSLILLLGIIVVSIIILMLSQLIRSRVNTAVRRSREINQMMTQALNSGNYHVLEIDLHSNFMRNIFGNLLPYDGLSTDEFIKKIHPDDQARVHKDYGRIIKGEIPKTAVRDRWNAGTENNPDWRYLQGHAISETEGGELRYIVLAIHDTTKEVKEERENREMGFKHMKMFDTNLVAMSFYNADGTLLDVNEKMKKICGFDEAGEKYFRQQRLFDAELLKGQYDPTKNEEFYVCQKMHYSDIGIDKYIEFRIDPTYDDQGEVRYYVVSARDVSAERIMYLEQRKHDQEIKKTNEIISGYERQMDYLLNNSDMLVWRSDRATQRFTFSRSLKEELFSLSFEEYVAETEDEEVSRATEAILDDEQMKQPFNMLHHYKRHPNQLLPEWGISSGRPIFDKDGHLTGHFGVIRDVTSLIKAQKKLKVESERAENSGKMKSAFLANMTHEIRTPLNAIVGFSDLLPMVETTEERMEFIRIIRNNCDMLMRLINDILEASNMGQALAILPVEVDFAQIFEDICQTLAQRVQEPGVAFVKDNPYEHYVTTLDKGRIQQVLTNFVTNAVKYTHEGHIKVGYRFERRMTMDEKGEADGLYFYCEDTGAGIPQQKQASVFERFVKLNDFVQGTGLGLSICKAIADRCNGHIGVTSEGEGHGSTFWLWIPCPNTNMVERA